MSSQSLSSISKKAVKWAPAAVVTGILCTTGSAQAAQLFATDVVYYNNNGTQMDEYRKNTNNALGDPELLTDSTNGYDGSKDFLSLGIGGRAVFDFGQNFSGNVTLWETTWGNKSSQKSYDERVGIYYGNFDASVDWSAVANDLSQWVSAGDIFNIQDGAYNTAAGATNAGASPSGIFNRVLLVDKSPNGKSRDGFDVNAIAAQGVDKQAVPEPTSVISLLLIGGLGIQSIRKRSMSHK